MAAGRDLWKAKRALNKPRPSRVIKGSQKVRLRPECPVQCRPRELHRADSTRGCPWAHLQVGGKLWLWQRSFAQGIPSTWGRHSSHGISISSARGGEWPRRGQRGERAMADPRATQPPEQNSPSNKAWSKQIIFVVRKSVSTYRYNYHLWFCNSGRVAAAALIRAQLGPAGC